MEVAQSFSVCEGDAPLQTWWDETQHHFLALTEVVGNKLTFQRLELPTTKKRGGDLLPSGVFVVTLHPIADDGGSTHVPLHAKLSLDHAWLVLQFSDTLLYILPCNDTTIRKQWTIDLATGDGHPTTTTASPNSSHATSSTGGGFRFAKATGGGGGGDGDDEVADTTTASTPTVASPKPSNPFRFRRKVPASIIGNASDGAGGTTSILWSEHGGNSQDLIVVTTESTMFYKVSQKRRKMSPTHTYAHPSTTKSWWDPVSRCLVVGSTMNSSRKDQPKFTTTLHTYLLQQQHTKNQQNHHHTFPRLELPPPDRFPVLTLSTQESNMDSMFLVSMRSQPYFVDVDPSGQVTVYALHHREGGSSNSAQQTTAHHRVCYTKAFTELAGPNFVTVVDGILCINSYVTETSVLIDIQDGKSFVVPHNGVNAQATSCFSPSLCFLAPRFLHDTRGHGTIHCVHLNLARIVEAFPENDCILPFLMQREENIGVAKALALSEMAKVVEGPDKEKRYMWLQAFIHAYSKVDVVDDWRASIPLMGECALLPDIEFHPRSVVLDNTTTTRSAHLMQKDVIEEILLLTTKKALFGLDETSSLENALDLCLEFVEILQQSTIDIVPALPCLIISILWRLGHKQEVVALIQSLVHMQPRVPERERIAATDLFVQAVLATVSHKQNDSKQASRAESPVMEDSIFERLIVMASPLLAGRLLLERGRLRDAIHVCSELVHSTRDKSEFAAMIPGEDFVKTAAKEIDQDVSVAEQCRLFHHVCVFLREWDPTSVEHQVSKPSRVALRNPNLFGGGTGESPHFAVVQRLLGYRND